MTLERCGPCWGTGREPSPVTIVYTRCRSCGGLGFRLRWGTRGAE